MSNMSTGAVSKKSGERLRGVIRRLVTEKSFGFIEDDKGVQYFFHRSGLEGALFETLTVGSQVEFTGRSGLKGPRAEQIHVVP